MDKKTRNKVGEAGSSDEEAFESADEGEEGENDVGENVATSPDTGSANSTSKDSVGKSESPLKEPVYEEEIANSGTVEHVNHSSIMDQEAGRENEEKPNEGTSEESPQLSSEASVGLAKTEEGDQNQEISGEGDTDLELLKSYEEDTKSSAHGEGNNDEEISERERVEAEQVPQSSESDPELRSTESLATEQDEGNEVGEVLQVEHPQAETLESSSTQNHDKIEEESDRPQEKPAQEPPSASGGWGWGGWSSMLTQATASVTSGLSSVIESVEMSLGVPDPEEMARKVKEEEKMVKENAKANKQETSEESKSGSDNEGAGSFLSGFGKDLMSGGLEALEFIGKKTMDVLAEGDPGLRHKRERLGGKGPSLSQVLKEAKETSEQKAASGGDESEGTTPKVDLFSKFDEYQGVAHLEALEILSRDSEAKLESRIIDLTEDELASVKPLLRAVEEVFHIDEHEGDDEAVEDGDFLAEIADNIKSLNVPCAPDKLITTHKTAREWVETCVKEQDEAPGSKDGLEIYSTAVSSIAELTARTVELFHKFTELLLLQDDKASETSSLVRAQSLRKLTDAVLEEISVLATHFAGCLNTAADDSDNPESVSSLITTVYLDSSTSASYLRNSLKLLRPVLQLSSLNEKKVSES